MSDTRFWDCTHAEYHADTSRVSHSALEVFRASVPRYHAEYVARTLVREATPEMRFGSAFHCSFLEPDQFDAQIAVAPKVDRRTGRGKEEWAAFLAGAGTRTVIEEDDLALIKAMREAVYREPMARKLMEAVTRREQGVVWTDRETGLPMKCKIDGLTECGPVIDVKTARDPSPEAWPRVVAQFGYHRQAALYLEAAWEVAALDGPFIFIAVGKEPPHEVVCHTIHEVGLAAANHENHALLRELAQRRRDDNWLSRWHGEVYETTVPGWAFASNPV